MGTYVTIYRWKPEGLIAFGKKWTALASGAVPKELQATLAKFKNLQLFYSITNSCIVGIYDIDDGDLIDANTVALYLADVCEMESFPVLNTDDYVKTAETYTKLFPDWMK